MIELDMNQISFQESFFQLEKTNVISVTNACHELRQMTWEQLYQHQGFNWEWISTKQYYTFRVSDKIRVAALRKGNILELQRIFIDHDSAYT
jgi:hypothetical protein